MPEASIKKIIDLDREVAALCAEGKEEGFFFVDRLFSDWQTGVNRFDMPGELLLGSYLGSELVGVGGVNRDPYVTGDVGRLRHLYVRVKARRGGVGTTLISHLIDHARNHFSLLRLRTDTANASAFYLACGFQRTAARRATHVLPLGFA